MTAPPSAARQAAILLAGKVLGTISEALVPLMIVRLWGKAEVGHVASAQLTYFALTTILQAGFPEAATYFLPGRTAPERRAVAAQLARILLGVGVLAATLLVLISGVSALSLGGSDWAKGATLLPWFALLALADLPSRMVTNVLVVEGRAATTAALGVFRATGVAVATLVPALSGWSPEGVVASTCAFGIGFAGLSLWVVRRHFRDAAPQPSPVANREVLRFAVPLGLTEVASITNAQLDRYLVLGWFTAETFAEYHAGAWQVPLIGSIPHIIGVAFTPQFVVWFGQGMRAEVLAAWRQLAVRTAVLVTPLSAVFIVGAEETMTLLFTDAYSDSATVFRLFSVFMMLRVATFGNLLLAAGRTGLITRASFLAVASNALITVPCVAFFGPAGAALGTTLAFLPTATYYCYGIAEITGVRLRAVYPLLGHARVILLVAVSSAPALAVKAWVPFGPGPLLALEATALLTTYAILATAVGYITPEDWRVATARVRQKLGG